MNAMRSSIGFSNASRRSVVAGAVMAAALLVASPLVRPALADHGHRKHGRHGKVVVVERTVRPVVVERSVRPVVVVQRRVIAPRVVVTSPVCLQYWEPVRSECVAPYAHLNWVSVSGRRYDYNAQFGLYLGGVAVNVQLGNRAPYGYAYYDPYCGEEFWSFDAYRNHLHRHDHRGVLEVVRVAYARGDGQRGNWNYDN